MYEYTDNYMYVVYCHNVNTLMYYLLAVYFNFQGYLLIENDYFHRFNKDKNIS